MTVVCTECGCENADNVTKCPCGSKISTMPMRLPAEVREKILCEGRYLLLSGNFSHCTSEAIKKVEGKFLCAWHTKIADYLPNHEKVVEESFKKGLFSKERVLQIKDRVIASMSGRGIKK